MRILLFFVIFLASSIVFGNGEIYARQNITLVFTSVLADVAMESGRGGLLQLATLLKKVRAENEHVLFLYGGGALSPSILSATLPLADQPEDPEGKNKIASYPEGR